MTSRVSKLVLAAVLAGSLPAAAAARDCEHDRPVVVAPAPWQPAPMPPPAGWDRDREHGLVWRGREHRRELAWRERELASVRAELWTLEAQRAEFHARNAWRPGQLRRYDRFYFERRAELERREHELQPLAWR